MVKERTEANRPETDNVPGHFRAGLSDRSYSPVLVSPVFMGPSSALPDFYYAVFALYEPFISILGFVGTLVDPKTVHDQQAPWPNGANPSPELPLATLVTLLQLAHVCALMGTINFFVLTALRQLDSQPALQEKIVRSLLLPLLVGDFLHIYVTLWPLGAARWHITTWGPTLWATVVLGLSLMIPRIAWHLGIGRYVDRRDAPTRKA